MSTVAEIGSELRRIRRASEIRQDAIADISPVSICRMEKGTRGKTRFESLAKYAEALGYELVLRKREEGIDDRMETAG